MRKNTKFKFAAMASFLSAFGSLASAQIAITPSSLGNFTSRVGSASSAQMLTLNATGPLGAVLLTAPTGFEISKNATTGFARSITLGTPGGSIQSVYKGGFATHTGTVWNNGSGSEFPNLDAYTAITSNGSVAAWGYDSNGGSMEVIINVWDGPNSYSPTAIRSVAANLTSNVTTLYSNGSAFAALKDNGSLITWGDVANGGNSTVVVSNTINGTKLTSEILSVAGSLSSNVKNIFSNREAFAALKNTGSLITWGDVAHGGNSTVVVSNSINGTTTTSEIASVAGLLGSNVTNVYSNQKAFAALKSDGSVITWGEVKNGGNSTVVATYWIGETEITDEMSSVAGSLSSNVKNIFSNRVAFAALKSDGSLITWGDSSWGGNSTSVAAQIVSNVRNVFSTEQAFAALKSDGSVITWGDDFWGGNSTSVATRLASDVLFVFSNPGAFAALKSNGSVITWGHIGYGGNSSVVLSNKSNGIWTNTEIASVSGMLSSNLTTIVSNEGAFAALKSNGSVVTWGDIVYGGNSTVAKSVESGDTTTTTEVSSVAGLLSSNITALYSNQGAFAALKKDGSVVAWGDVTTGGNLTRLDYLDESWNLTETENVASQLSSGVIGIFSNSRSFAALKSDGSIVAWGHNSGGEGTAANIGESTSGLPSVVYVRMATNSNVGALSGNLTFSTLGAEIESLPLSGSFTGSSDSGGNSGGSSSGGGGGGAPSGGGSSQVQKSNKGKGKSSSANKSSGGSNKSSAKKSSGGSSKKDKGSKSSSKKKSGGGKKSKK
jgi:hypothetical protein